MDVFLFNLFVLVLLLYVFYTVANDRENPRERKGRNYFSAISAHHEPASFSFIRQDQEGRSHYQASPGMNLNINVQQRLNQVHVTILSASEGLHQVILAFQYNYRTDKLVFTKTNPAYRSHAKWLTSNIVYDFKLQQICPIHKDVQKSSVSQITQPVKSSAARHAVITSDNNQIQSLLSQNQTLITDLTAVKNRLSLESQHQLERAEQDLHNVLNHFSHAHPNHRKRLEPTFLTALIKLNQDLLSLDEQLYKVNQQRMDYLLAVVENR